MKECYQCGRKLKSVRADYPYNESGLPVVLKNIEILRCPHCGDSPVIPRIEKLHDSIAAAVLRKATRLTGPEVRFLRKHLGLPMTTFAKTLHVDLSTLSRWERGDDPIGRQSDFLIRFVVSATRPSLRRFAAGIANQLARIGDKATAGKWVVDPKALDVRNAA